MARKEWKPLPAVTALTGAAEFFKTAIVERFTKELFGGSPTEIRRFQGPANERDEASLPLAVVLDELRTPSFFSPHRLVILEQANAFIALHAEYLVRHLKGGFGGGYLILLVEGKLDGRTRFAKHLAKEGWIVECAQPYDRPPPWDTRAPAWDSELTHWVVAQAKAKGLQIDPPTAFLLHERAGTDLAVLDEEIEKIATYLASKNTSVADGDSIQAVIGDLREDTVFVTLELFLEGRRREALQSLHRLFEHGLPTDRGLPRASRRPLPFSSWEHSSHASARSAAHRTWRRMEWGPSNGWVPASSSVPSCPASSERWPRRRLRGSSGSWQGSTTSTRRSRAEGMPRSFWNSSSSSIRIGRRKDSLENSRARSAKTGLSCGAFRVHQDHH